MKKLSALFTLSLCLFTLYGCGTKCYDQNWNLDEHPEKNEKWQVINCYNENGEKNWKRTDYYADWAIWNYIDGKREWKWILYYSNWQIFQ